MLKPAAQAGCDKKVNLAGLNSEFSFSETECHKVIKKPSLFHNLPWAGGRKYGFITFPRVLVLSEM